MLEKISREIDYIAEGMALLQHLGKGEKYAGLKESLSKKYGNPFREGLLKFKLLEQLELVAEKKFLKEMEEIRYYFFSGAEEENSCPGKVALLWNDAENTWQKDVGTWRKCLADLSEEEYFGTGDYSLKGL